MATRPLVSIVVSCYNRADRLPETLESVFAQAYAPVEVLVVDDGSTDGTRELLAGYGDRVRYHWHANRGIAYTRTVGGQLARGEYVAYQDDDDLMPPQRIVTLLDALERHPGSVMAAGDWAIIDESSKPSGERSEFGLPRDRGPVVLQEGRRAVLWPRLSPVPHTTLFRRADGERIGWFDERFFHACEDTDFYARLAGLGSIVYVPEVVSLYRKGPGLSTPGVAQMYSRFLLYEKHLVDTVDRDEELRRRLQDRLLVTLRALARLDAEGEPFPERASRARLREAAGLLRPRQRATYAWVTAVRLPLRRWIRRLAAGRS